MICEKIVNDYPHVKDSLPNCYMSQEMYEKSVNTCPYTLQFVVDWYKTQKMCEKAVDTCHIFTRLSLLLLKDSRNLGKHCFERLVKAEILPQ